MVRNVQMNMVYYSSDYMIYLLNTATLYSVMEIVIIKVSGPPEIDNHIHFVEDRRKIPITLEKTIKKITQNHPNTNKAVLSKIV